MYCFFIDINSLEKFQYEFLDRALYIIRCLWCLDMNEATIMIKFYLI